MDEQVAAARLVEPLHAPAVHRDDLARLRARPHVDLLGAVERLHGEVGAERGGRHRDLDRAVQVVAAPLEDLVRTLDDLQEQVSRRAAAGADLALAGELDVRAVLDARGDADLDRTAGAYAAVTRALLARVADDRPEAAALGARPGGHDLAQERPGDLGDLAAPVAHVTGVGVGAGRGARALADLAEHGRVDDQLAGGAEGGLAQVELDADGRVAPSPGPRAGSARAAGRAEEGVHDVAEREARAEAGRSLPRARAAEGVAAQVVHLTLVGVGQHLVGLRDLLEPLLGRGVRIDVGMEFAGKPAVGLLDLFLTGVTAHPEGGVVVAVCHLSTSYDAARIWLT